MARLSPSDRRKRRAWAVSLHLGGATYQAIADTCGYSSRGNAHKDIAAALQELLDESDTSAGEMRRVLLARLERLTYAAWPDAMEGDNASIRTISRLIGQQITLYGLADPKRLEEQVSQDHDAELERLISLLIDGERARLDAERAELAAAGPPKPARRRRSKSP